MSALTPLYTPYEMLYRPPDVECAHQAWQANCGPCTLAAVLGVPVERVRRCFPDFARTPWVNPSTMWTALSLARRPGTRLERAWPRYGVVFVQWEGPWLGPGVPVTAAYRYTHWLGVAETREYGRMVYDLNAWDDDDQRGDWMPLDWWEQEIRPLLTEEIPRATGGWHLRWSCEVVPVHRQEEAV